MKNFNKVLPHPLSLDDVCFFLFLLLRRLSLAHSLSPGIEKAERNVLPVLNNLLENREMHLEDGRFLLAPERYDALLKKHTKAEIDAMKLLRVNEHFMIIALGSHTVSLCLSVSFSLSISHGFLLFLFCLLRVSIS